VEYANEADWQEAATFLKSRKLDGRLDIITKRLIKLGHPTSAKPHLTLVELLVEAGRVNEVDLYLPVCKLLCRNEPSDTFACANILFKIGRFDECLSELSNHANYASLQFHSVVLEARALWKLGKRKFARTKMEKLIKTLGGDTWQWSRCVELALEFNDRLISNQCADTLVRLVGEKSPKLTQSIVLVLERSGYGVALDQLIDRADPGSYSNIAEYLFIFKQAMARGAAETAIRFGNAIMAADPDHELKREIEQLPKRMGFLIPSAN
jgi:hypothetical protein